MAKATFDGIAKTITIISGNSSIDVQTDIYSDWKEWVASGNTQWEPALRTFGGDPTVPGQAAPMYFFLTNGWRVIVDGFYCSFAINLYTDEGTSPFVLLNGAEVLNKISDSPVVYTSDSVAALTPEEHEQLMGLENTDNAAIIGGVTGSTSMTTLFARVEEILGLSQSNYEMINQSYDGDGNLLSATVATYPTAVDLGLGTNRIATYEMTATYSSGALSSYKVEKQ